MSNAHELRKRVTLIASLIALISGCGFVIARESGRPQASFLLADALLAIALLGVSAEPEERR